MRRHISTPDQQTSTGPHNDPKHVPPPPMSSLLISRATILIQNLLEITVVLTLSFHFVLWVLSCIGTGFVNESPVEVEITRTDCHGANAEPGSRQQVLIRRKEMAEIFRAQVTQICCGQVWHVDIRRQRQARRSVEGFPRSGSSDSWRQCV